MKVVFSHHALDRIVARGLDKLIVERYARRMPRQNKEISWRFPNGYYLVTSYKEDIDTMVVITAGRRFKYGKRVRY